MAEKWDSDRICRAVEMFAGGCEKHGSDPEEILIGIASGLAILLARIEPESARDQMVKSITAVIPDGVDAARRLARGLPADPATNDNLH